MQDGQDEGRHKRMNEKPVIAPNESQGETATDYTSGDRDEIEFDPMPYLRLLWRRRFLVSTVTLAFGVAALVVSLLLPTMYEATARVYVGEPDSPGHAQTIGRVRVLAQDPGTVAQVLASPEVASLSTSLTLAQLQKATTAQNGVPPNVVPVRLC